LGLIPHGRCQDAKPPTCFLIICISLYSRSVWIKVLNEENKKKKCVLPKHISCLFFVFFHSFSEWVILTGTPRCGRSPKWRTKLPLGRGVSTGQRFSSLPAEAVHQNVRVSGSTALSTRTPAMLAIDPQLCLDIIATSNQPIAVRRWKRLCSEDRFSQKQT